MEDTGDYDVYGDDGFDEGFDDDDIEDDEVDEAEAGEEAEAADAAEEAEEDNEEHDEDSDEEGEDDRDYEPDEELVRSLANQSELDDDLTDFQKVMESKRKMLNIPGPQKKLTKYEFTAIIGYRAQQIAEGAAPYVTVAEGTDPITIAINEFDRNLIPLMIERPLPSNKIGKFKYETYQLDQLINVISTK